MTQRFNQAAIKQLLTPRWIGTLTGHCAIKAAAAAPTQGLPHPFPPPGLSPPLKPWLCSLGADALASITPLGEWGGAERLSRSIQSFCSELRCWMCLGWVGWAPPAICFLSPSQLRAPLREKGGGGGRTEVTQSTLPLTSSHLICRDTAVLSSLWPQKKNKKAKHNTLCQESPKKCVLFDAHAHVLTHVSQRLAMFLWRKHLLSFLRAPALMAPSLKIGLGVVLHFVPPLWYISLFAAPFFFVQNLQRLQNLWFLALSGFACTN